MSYIDTSVIVAALDPQDPRMEKARSLLGEKGDKVVSEIVLVELASLLSRRTEITRTLAARLGLSGEEAVVAVILYILRRFGLRYRGVSGAARLPLLGRVYQPVATAIELAPRAKLRTLDLLHIAYAKLLKERGEAVERLVTMDKGFEKARRALREDLGIDLYVVD